MVTARSGSSEDLSNNVSESQDLEERVRGVEMCVTKLKERDIHRDCTQEKILSELEGMKKEFKDLSDKVKPGPMRMAAFILGIVFAIATPVGVAIYTFGATPTRMEFERVREEIVVMKQKTALVEAKVDRLSDKINVDIRLQLIESLIRGQAKPR